MLDLLFSEATFRLITIGSIAYIGLIYLTLVIWTIMDSISRSENFFFQLFSTLLVMIFNILGLVIYLVIRPAMTREEKYDEEIEREYILKQNMGERCAKCKGIVKSDYKICPVCTYELKTECKKCKKLIQPNFRICPYCGDEQVDTDTKPKK